MEDYLQKLREEAAIEKVKEAYTRDTLSRVSVLGIWASLCALIGRGSLYLGSTKSYIGFLAVAIVLALIALFSIIARIRRSGIGGQLSGTAIDILSIALSFGLSLGFIFSGLPEAKAQQQEVLKNSCANNLRHLNSAINMYARKHNRRYPPPEKWCDLLIKDDFTKRAYFSCPGVEIDSCHYAMNPNARPYTKKRRVLLFETKDSWNQYGGPEILTTENHEGKGCNILFTNGDIKFVTVDKLDGLRW